MNKSIQCLPLPKVYKIYNCKRLQLCNVTKVPKITKIFKNLLTNSFKCSIMYIVNEINHNKPQNKEVVTMRMYDVTTLNTRSLEFLKKYYEKIKYIERVRMYNHYEHTQKDMTNYLNTVYRIVKAKEENTPKATFKTKATPKSENNLITPKYIGHGIYTI